VTGLRAGQPGFGLRQGLGRDSVFLNVKVLSSGLSISVTGSNPDLGIIESFDFH
jgi:hypothetical protein